ncbi:IclR family transcriptional regulator domain-containing protein, partial [Mycobacterium intracellulare]
GTIARHPSVRGRLTTLDPQDLTISRKSGFATSREESEEGVASVAVAIPARGPDVRLALNASAPSYRLRPSHVRKVAGIIGEAAAELATKLV